MLIVTEDFLYPFYFLQIVSKELQNEAMMDKALVQIYLIDYNDEVPKFNQSQFSISILETAKKGTIITQITATDRDAEDKDSLV